MSSVEHELEADVARYGFREMLSDVRSLEVITAEAFLAAVAAHTNLAARCESANVSVEFLLSHCRACEWESVVGRNLLERLRPATESVTTALAASRIAIPVDFGVTQRCTPLAAEIVMLSMDPRFEAEFMTKRSRGETLDDPSSYRYEPVRPLADTVAAALDVIATLSPHARAPLASIAAAIRHDAEI